MHWSQTGRKVDAGGALRYTGKRFDFATISTRIAMSFIRRVKARPTIVLLLVFGTSIVVRHAAAQEKQAALRVEQSAVKASVGGLHLCVPEKWSVLELTVTNPLDVPQEILTATYFDGAPTLQYGRRVWVPGRAKLTNWLPVLLPKLSPGETMFKTHSVVLDATQSQEILHREDRGGVLYSGIVPHGSIVRSQD
jgi:hypothetical protein